MIKKIIKYYRKQKIVREEIRFVKEIAKKYLNEMQDENPKTRRLIRNEVLDRMCKYILKTDPIIKK